MRARLFSLFAIAALLGLAGIAGPCAAVEYFYKDLPVARMTDDDFKLATPVIRRALDEGAEGQTHSWENPATGASGSIKLRSPPFTRKGTTCRRAEFMTSAGGLRNVSAWTLCKLPEGWKAVE